jgi:hypothetical protein
MCCSPRYHRTAVGGLPFGQTYRRRALLQVTPARHSVITELMCDSSVNTHQRQPKHSRSLVQELANRLYLGSCRCLCCSCWRGAACKISLVQYWQAFLNAAAQPLRPSMAANPAGPPASPRPAAPPAAPAPAPAGALAPAAVPPPAAAKLARVCASSFSAPTLIQLTYLQHNTAQHIPFSRRSRSSASGCSAHTRNNDWICTSVR